MHECFATEFSGTERELRFILLLVNPYGMNKQSLMNMSDGIILNVHASVKTNINIFHLQR